MVMEELFDIEYLWFYELIFGWCVGCIAIALTRIAFGDWK